MFGYVNIDKPNMFIKDYTVYRAFYCGLCVAIGRNYGNVKRLLTNFDVTFYTIFIHAVLERNIEIHNSGCILNPIKKKAIVVKNDLMDTMADLTILLTAYKLNDDIVDNGSSSKKAARVLLNNAIKKATKKQPEIAAIIKQRCNELAKLEQENSAIIDMVAEPFANMLKDITKVLLKERADRHTDGLMYNIGRWIYLMDAIDDAESDMQKKQYNPLLAAKYPCDDKMKFLTVNAEKLQFLLYSTISQIKMYYEGVPIRRYEGIITNILWYGLQSRSNTILKGEKFNDNSRRMEITI